MATISFDLVINLETEMKYTPVSEWKMKKEGLKRVVLHVLTRQIIAAFAAKFNLFTRNNSKIPAACLIPTRIAIRVRPGFDPDQ